MATILKQSTAVDVLIGPFVDSTDGYTAETGVSPAVKLSKNGQALAAKNDATTPTHDADGYYNCELDATDTNTVGTLVLSVVGSATSLPVRHEFQVVEEATYDFLYASGATPIADINAECDTAISDASLATASALATVDSNVDAILLDTGTNGVVLAGTPDVNVAQISGDAAAANNLEADYDGTGYNKTNSTIGTCTTNTDMRGTDSAYTGTPPTAAAIADQVWDESTTGHTTGGTFGYQVKTLIDSLVTLVSGQNDLSAAEVNAEVDSALSDMFSVAHSEPTGVPAANETVLDKIAYLFMAMRNQVTVTATKKTYFDDGGTAEFEKDLSDDGTTYTESEANAI